MNFKYVKRGRDMENEMNYGSEKALPGIPIEYEATNPRYKDVTDIPGMNKISLVVAIDEAITQADKLAQMVMELTQRLEPVRRESNETAAPDDFKMNVARPRPNYGSPFAARVYNIVDVIKSSQAQIARTMDELDL